MRTKEQKRKYLKEWQNLHRNDPEQIAKRKTYARKHHEDHQANDPAYRARRARSSKRWQQDHKDDEEHLVRRKKADKAHYNRIRNDPVLWIEAKRKAKIRKARFRKRHKHDQNHIKRRRAQQRAWRLGPSRGIYLAYRNTYRKEHPDKITAWLKAWTFKNQDHLRQYRADNKEHLDALRRQWRLEHPERVRELKRADYNRRRGQIIQAVRAYYKANLLRIREWNRGYRLGKKMRQFNFAVFKVVAEKEFGA